MKPYLLLVFEAMQQQLVERIVSVHLAFRAPALRNLPLLLVCTLPATDQQIDQDLQNETNYCYDNARHEASDLRCKTCEGHR